MLLSLLLSTSAHAAELEPYAMGQMWVTLYDMDEAAQADPAGYGDPEDDPGFKLRRARLGMVRPAEFGATPAERLGVSMILGMSAGSDPIPFAATGQLGLIDANISYAANENLTVYGGLVKVPWGRENQFSSLQLPFQDRTVQSNHMVSLREVGALAVWNAPANLRVQGGVYNGNGSLLGDEDNLFLFAGRVDWTLGGDHSQAYRSFGVVDAPVIGVGADVVYNDEAAVDELVVGGDLIFRMKGLTVIGEGHWARLTPTDTTVVDPAVLAQTTRIGAYAQVGYTVAERWEPVVRWETFDEDTALSDNGDLMHTYAGVTGHFLEDKLRVGGGYVLRMETGGANISNDTARLWIQGTY